MLDAIPRQVEFTQAPGHLERVFGAVPRVAHGGCNLVDEGLGAIPGGAVLGRDVSENGVVVGVETLGDVVMRDALAGESGALGAAVRASRRCGAAHTLNGTPLRHRVPPRAVRSFICETSPRVPAECRRLASTRPIHTSAPVCGIRCVDRWRGCREVQPSWGSGAARRMDAPTGGADGNPTGIRQGADRDPRGQGCVSRGTSGCGGPPLRRASPEGTPR